MPFGTCMCIYTNIKYGQMFTKILTGDFYAVELEIILTILLSLCISYLKRAT